MVPNLPVVLTLLGLVAYVLVRLGYDGFYNALEVRPDDVGITYLDILTRAALPGLAIGLSLVACAAIATILPWRFSRPSLGFLGIGVGFAVVALIAYQIQVYDPALLQRLSPPLPLLGTHLGLVGLFGVGVLLGLLLGLRDVSRKTALLADSLLFRSRGALLIAMTAVLLSSLLTLNFFYGEAVAHRVAVGEAQQPTAALSAFFDFRSDRTCVAWVGNDQPTGLDLTHPLMYLGQANGVVVLYSPAQKATASHPASIGGPVRIPADKVVTTPATDGQTSCPST
jgi:hypothetical protein